MLAALLAGPAACDRPGGSPDPRPADQTAPGSANPEAEAPPAPDPSAAARPLAPPVAAFDRFPLPSAQDAAPLAAIIERRDPLNDTCTIEHLAHAAQEQLAAMVQVGPGDMEHMLEDGATAEILADIPIVYEHAGIRVRRGGSPIAVGPPAALAMLTSIYPEGPAGLEMSIVSVEGDADPAFGGIL